MRNHKLYQDKDKIGREKVFDCIENNKINLVNITPMQNGFDLYDFECLNSKNITLNVECKDRYITSYAFNDTVIDYPKFEENIRLAKYHNRKAILAVTYTDNVCRFWDLTYLYDTNNYIITRTNANVTTVENNGKTEKLLVHLDNNDCFKECHISRN